MDTITRLKALISRIIAILTSFMLMLHGGKLNGAYSVTFFDNDNATILSVVENVQENGYATPPSAPEKPGKTFLGWSGNYVDIRQDESVRAVYSDEQNVFVVSSANGKVGDSVVVLIKLDGNVRTCGFDFTIRYDEALELKSFDSDLDLDVTANDSPIDEITGMILKNQILLNFSATTNKTKPRNIIELTFKITDTAKKALLISLDMNSIKEISSNRTIDSRYELINGVIFIQ